MIWFSSCQKKAIPMAQNKSVDTLQQKPKLKPEIKSVSLKMGSISANDIQENFTFSDELLLNYSISLIENDKVVQTYVGIKKIGSVKQGQKIELDFLILPSLKVHRKQKIGVQLSLWEIDNYDQLSKTLNQVNTFGGILQVPIALAEWSSLSNPLGWFLWGTRAGGLGMMFLSKFDQNDLLGVSEIIWPFEEMQKGKVERFKRGIWKGGRNGINSYDYQFTYQIKASDD
ncbi:MAG: hypothetical protein ACKOWQ_07990 [Aquirufa sp.]